MPDGKRDKHPSWGLVVFHRMMVQGKHRLFGSPLEQHASTVQLTITHATRENSLGQDWYYSTGLPLIEVELSAAQFAALLTTMNVGDGVPCTVRFLDGKQVPEPPEDPPETERVREHFREDAEGVTKKLSELLAKANEMLSRGDLKAKDRKDLREHLASIVQDIEKNLPFVLRQFDRATERITNTAKAEVDAFVTGAATKLGIERLRELASKPETKLELDAGKEKGT